MTEQGLRDAGEEAIAGVAETASYLSSATREELVALVIDTVGELDSAGAEAINEFNILALEREIADTQGDTETLERIDAELAVLTATGVGVAFRGIVEKLGSKIGRGAGSTDTSVGDVNAGTRPGATDAEAGYPSNVGDSDALGNFALPSKEAREWYNAEIKKIDTDVPATRENAERISVQRAILKTEARDLMSDQDARLEIDEKNPIRDFHYYENRYRDQGYEGGELWERIIKGSVTPNSEVNDRFNIEG